MRTLLTLALCLACSLAAADDVTLRLKGLTRGQSYELVYGTDGSITLLAIRTVVVDVTPVPVPTPVLTPRGTLIRDAALKATADTKRGETAVMLAMLYTEIGKRVGTGEIPLDKVGAAIRAGTDQVLTTQGAPPDSWKVMRDELAKHLVPTLQEGPQSVSTLLTESAAGLEASVTNFQAIDRDKLRDIILAIILLILQNL